ATPYTWSLAAGTLPAGLTLNSAGTITGTPTTTGTANLTVRVTDAADATTTKALGITVLAPQLAVAQLTITAAQWGSWWFPTARIRVVDGVGAPVDGATVTGRWIVARSRPRSQTATTNTSGWATPGLALRRAAGQSVTFCLNTVTRAGYPPLSANSCVSTRLWSPRRTRR
ncbi:MAG: hypothetical protein FJW86_12750, partial [Actinobacteria bacterium]|nr:hypothetical protein [Actinomycetota bacterium]